jgi:hypothetical protein
VGEPYDSPALQRLRACIASPTGYCSLRLSSLGKLVAQEHLLSSPCLQQEYLKAPHGAHPTGTFRCIVALQGDDSTWYRAYPLTVRGLHRTLWVLFIFPCPPSPCSGHCPDHLSSMGTLSPCPSQGLGDPDVSRYTCVVVRSSTHRIPLSVRVVTMEGLLRQP